MWPLKKQDPKPKKVYRLTSLRPCHCGAMSYGSLRASDTVHCNGCGAMYLIEGFLGDKVAKYEYVDAD